MIGCFSLLGAIGWQGFYGHRNFEFQHMLLQKSLAVQVELASVVAKRKALEARVAMVRPGTIDADLADEIARRDLNMGGKRDFVAHILN